MKNQKTLEPETLKEKSDRLLKEKIFEEVEIFFTKMGTGKRHAVDERLINSLNKKINTVLEQPTYYELENQISDLIISLQGKTGYSPEMEIAVNELKDKNEKLFFWLSQEEQREYCKKLYELKGE